MVQNGWWKLLMVQKTDEGYFEVAKELRSKMLHGVFPDEVKEQFQLMLEYFGQSPIIVRSSSLLEDAFGNAFAGKYESYFCPNQGTPEERYRHFEEAVRKIFASTMNEDALTYRLQRGMAHQDEQMALLVQRVSGSHRSTIFSRIWRASVCPTIHSSGKRAWTRKPGCCALSSAWEPEQSIAWKMIIRVSSP